VQLAGQPVEIAHPEPAQVLTAELAEKPRRRRVVGSVAPETVGRLDPATLTVFDRHKPDPRLKQASVIGGRIGAGGHQCVG
jgi:hypothetical protein